MPTKKSLEDVPAQEVIDSPKNNYMISLVDNLKNELKKGEDFFDPNASVITYKTGIPQLDYYLGYRVNVYDKNDKVIDSYPSIGITGGSFVTFIGKPSTSKTTTAIQIAANIVRDYENGIIIHYDLEQACNYSRIRNLTKFTMSQMKAGKYILRQEVSTIEDIKRSIMRVYFEKTKNPETYLKKTGKLNEFGEEIEVFEPTVVIIDSIASLSTGFNENDKKDIARLEEVGSQTEKMRITGEIGRFFTELLPYIRKANITVITINQIKAKPQLGFVHQPAEILYLSPDEALPGGVAPQFYAHILLKFIAVGSEKYTQEENGFDGFGVKTLIVKSRGNQAGRYVNLVYDKVRGIDPVRSSVNYAKELGLTGGNKNAFYFNSDKDVKFTLTNIHEDFRNNKELYKIMFKNIIPELESKLSMLTEDDLEVIEEEMNY